MTYTRRHATRASGCDAATLKRKYGPGPIGRFYEDCWTPECQLFSMFTFVKCFRQDEREQPTPLATLIGPRLAPAPGYQAASPLADARRDFVLPSEAPNTINSIAEVIAAFDSVPPLRRDVMIEMKFYLHSKAAPHLAYEAVRDFARRHFAGQRGLAAMMVLHLPGRSGAKGVNHIHLFVPARRLTPQGFGANSGRLVHDRGFEEVCAAWHEWRQSQSSASYGDAT